ncbi:MAG: hypothetical protein HY235_20470 [Acidobacteria bacterium]|nr:hypothetical protein [Acidobacteriota bacterium]
MAITYFIRDLQAPELVNSADGADEERLAAALERICARDVRAIHFGHGAPLVADCNARLQRSLGIVTKKEGEL